MYIYIYIFFFFFFFFSLQRKGRDFPREKGAEWKLRESRVTMALIYPLSTAGYDESSHAYNCGNL